MCSSAEVTNNTQLHVRDRFTLMLGYDLCSLLKTVTEM